MSMAGDEYQARMEVMRERDQLAAQVRAQQTEIDRLRSDIDRLRSAAKRVLSGVDFVTGDGHMQYLSDIVRATVPPNADAHRAP